MRIETYIPGLSKNTVDIVKHAESLGYDAVSYTHLTLPTKA